jgi:hypothetical protein
MGIQTFARFVPEAVVRNIIKGADLSKLGNSLVDW